MTDSTSEELTPVATINASEPVSDIITDSYDKNAKIENEDRVNARNRELESQKSDNKSWIYKNINPVLAIMALIFSFAFFVYILQFDFETETSKKDIVMILIGAVNSVIIMVLGYFFGSSKGSSDKDKIIQSQMQRKPPEY